LSFSISAIAAGWRLGLKAVDHVGEDIGRFGRRFLGRGDGAEIIRRSALRPLLGALCPLIERCRPPIRFDSDT